MALSLTKISKAHKILEEYNGKNPYIISLKNSVFVYKDKTLNDFEIEYILTNFNSEPILLNKMVKVADWYGEKKQNDWKTDFLIEKFIITYFLGETRDFYHFFVRYRRSQEKPIPLFAPKKAILTPIFVENWEDKEVNFEKYNRISGLTLKPHQERSIKFLLTRKKAILSLEQGLGKEIDINTILPTPNGYRKADDVQIGDMLFASNGKPTKVLGKYYQGEKDIYEITFSDGEKANCGLEHQWIVKRITRKKWETKTLRDLLNEGIYAKMGNWRKEHNENLVKLWEIPMCKPVEYDEKKYFIHPYLLGLALGDGNLCSGRFVISIPDFEKETVERIKPLIKENFLIREDKYCSCPRYSIIYHKKGYKNEYIQEIKRLKLNVHGNDKFIPLEYMQGSINQRLDLLRGLLDSDGAIRPKNKIGFYSNSLKLINDVKTLVQSLGGRATLHKYDRRKSGKNIEYSLTIQIKFNPFYLERKAKQYTIDETHTRYCRRYIKDIKLVRRSQAVCFYVDSEDHSFLTEHYIVTHNTISSIVAALEGGYEKILVICPASLKLQWKDEISRFTSTDEITVVEGSKWKENKFTIINYDILKNFYVVPKELRNFKTKEYTDDGKIKWKTVSKNVKTNKSDIVSSAMEESQLFQSQFDLIIIDESHRLSNKTSGMYEIVEDLIKRSNPKGIFELTGTIIKNNPSNLYNVLKLIGADVTKDWVGYMTRYCGAKQIFRNRKERDFYTTNFLKTKGKTAWVQLSYQEKQELDAYLARNCKKIWIMGEASNLDELSERIKHLYYREVNDFDKQGIKKETILKEYTLNQEEKVLYDSAWNDYINSHDEKNVDKLIQNHKLIEGAVFRQLLADFMVKRTIELAEEEIAKEKRIIIFCCFDKELYTLQDYFKERCVVYNGKLTLNKKTETIDKFKSDENIKVFIGNIQAASVGLNLNECCVCIFNNVSFVPSDNSQAEFRCCRLGQDKDVTIYYQKFNGTYQDRLFEILDVKTNISNAIIKSEDGKQ